MKKTTLLTWAAILAFFSVVTAASAAIENYIEKENAEQTAIERRFIQERDASAREAHFIQASATN
jgi:hypothetical protein